MRRSHRSGTEQRSLQAELDASLVAPMLCVLGLPCNRCGFLPASYMRRLQPVIKVHSVNSAKHREDADKCFLTQTRMRIRLFALIFLSGWAFQHVQAVRPIDHISNIKGVVDEARRERVLLELFKMSR